jgi:hypothetical protein
MGVEAHWRVAASAQQGREIVIDHKEVTSTGCINEKSSG